MTRPRLLEEDVAELLLRPHRRRHVERRVTLDGLEVAGTRVPSDEPIDVDVVLESLPSAIRVTGRAHSRWVGTCRRCLEPLERELDAPVDEVFELEPVPDETWPIERDQIDLEPAVREAMLLALPLAPLCRDACAGPDPERFPTGPVPDEDGSARPRDPRWAALDDLDLG